MTILSPEKRKFLTNFLLLVMLVVAANAALALFPQLREIVRYRNASETYWEVDVSGPVRYPGRCLVFPGDRLAELVRRSGGLRKGYRFRDGAADMLLSPTNALDIGEYTLSLDTGWTQEWQRNSPR